jgi:cytochrome o ubiquinol oxidase subunit 2
MRRIWPYAIAVSLAGFLTLLLILAHGKMTLLMPAGMVALGERTLMLNAVLLMLVVIIPVYILTFFFAWHYRAGNTTAKYEPEWEHSKMDELVWWAIPFEIILVLGALTWTSTHELDPRKPLDEAQGKPLEVQVVSLDWKWLFIYPNEHIASVGEAAVPLDRPVEFEVTADSPMNSFWIPQLGSQIYAMPGMINTLHLIANRPGDYEGLGANYTGDGFANMKFTVRAVNSEQFDAWIASTRQSGQTLSKERYTALAHPSEGYPITYFGNVEEGLYSSIVAKYTGSNSPTHQH